MKEIPILFSTPMVQAILEGRKSQTRRIMEPQPWYGSQVPDGPHFIFPPGSGQRFNAEVSKNGNWYVMQEGFQRYFSKMAKWQPGDLLWVREIYKIEGSMSHGESVLGVKYKAGGRWIQNDSKEVFDIFHKSKEGWRPNIFLPKIAARIWLQVTDIRVERLQDISEEDAKAEGVEKIDDSIFCWRHYGGKYAGCSTARNSFQSIWKSINGDESWNINPWVWVISFNILSTTGKPK